MLLERHRFGLANSQPHSRLGRPQSRTHSDHQGRVCFVGGTRGVRCKRGSKVDQMKPFEVKELLLWCHVRSVQNFGPRSGARIKPSPPDVFLGRVAPESQ